MMGHQLETKICKTLAKNQTLLRFGFSFQSRGPRHVANTEEQRCRFVKCFSFAKVVYKFKFSDVVLFFDFQQNVCKFNIFAHSFAILCILWFSVGWLWSL